MKKTILFSLALATFGILTSSCEGKPDSCVEDYMNDDMSQSEAEEKCDEELVETVVVMDELR